MLVFSAMAELGDDRLVSARHEAAAVAMADGYARVSGQVGVATVTCGPGLTQVATSLVAAARCRSPLVLLAGDTPSRDASGLQVFDQGAFATVCEAGYVRVHQVGEIPAATREAFVRAFTERRPIMLSVPQDVQQQESRFESAQEFEYAPVPEIQAATVPSPDRLEALARRLLAAERPIVVAGLGSMGQGVPGKIRLVAERIGALLATSLPAKGLFLGDPWDIGVSGAFASRVAENLMVNADLVLGIGASLAYYTTEGGFLYPDAAIIRIDKEPDSRSQLEGQTVLIGDVSATIEALNAELVRLGARSAGYRTPAVAQLLTEQRPDEWPDLADDGVDPRALMDVLAPYIPADARIVVGVGHFWAFPIMYLAGTSDNRWLFSYQFGSIGQTLPVAIGAWFADRSRPLVMFDGDGSLLQAVQELDTVVRNKIPLVIIVGNDGGFGAEVHKLRAAGLRDEIVSFPTPDFAAIAAAFGGDGQLVSTLDQVDGAEALLKSPQRLLVLDVRVSPHLASDPYRRLHYGEENRAPRLVPRA
jgi:acetolactate synthase I/II/III large subunit